MTQLLWMTEFWVSTVSILFANGRSKKKFNLADVDDLKDVLDAVETLASQWSLLSLKLGVKQSSLDVIEHNNFGNAKTCLYKALGEWLRQNYSHQKHGKPSWRRLAEAVQSLDHSLFEKIAKEHSS